MALAQSVIDEIDQAPAVSTNPLTQNLVTEKIERLSPTGQIFLLTNTNLGFARGDFISLVYNDQLIVRGLVARMRDDLAGVKITKYYNQEIWKNLGVGSQVQVIRGDDSYFTNQAKNVASSQEEIELNSLIQEEEDLYNSTTLAEDESLIDQEVDENKDRLIKTDNIVSFGYGWISGLTTSGQDTRYGIFNASYSYQIEDNIWVEGLFGQSTVNDFPNTGLDTKFTNITVRAKYTFQGPFYSYIMPYLGYQSVTVSSPGAGVSDGTTSQDVLDEEARLVNESEKSGAIAGVALLKRMVPGWFLRAELGTDIINLGLSLEF